MAGFSSDDMVWYSLGVSEGERRSRGVAEPQVEPSPPRPPLEWPLDDDLSGFSDMEMYALQIISGHTMPPRERERRDRLVALERDRRKRVQESAALQRERDFLAARATALRAAAERRRQDRRARRSARWMKVWEVFRRALAANPGPSGRST